MNTEKRDGVIVGFWLIMNELWSEQCDHAKSLNELVLIDELLTDTDLSWADEVVSQLNLTTTKSLRHCHCAIGTEIAFRLRGVI